eukprot:30294-Pelagococcus_subviridis.AAC.112
MYPNDARLARLHLGRHQRRFQLPELEPDFRVRLGEDPPLADAHARGGDGPLRLPHRLWEHADPRVRVREGAVRARVFLDHLRDEPFLLPALRRLRRVLRGDVLVLLQRVRIPPQRLRRHVRQELPHRDLPLSPAQHFSLRPALPFRDRAEESADDRVPFERLLREPLELFRVVRVAQRERRVLQQLLRVPVQTQREALHGSEPDLLQRGGFRVRVSVVRVDPQGDLVLVVRVLPDLGGEPVGYQELRARALAVRREHLLPGLVRAVRL